MSKRNNKKTVGVSDIWAMCGLFALLLLLFLIPGIIIDGQPVSALQLARASELRQFGQFPGRIAQAQEMWLVPLLSTIGILTTLLMRRSTGKYAFGACISAMLFGMIGVYQTRCLPHAGGFVIGTAMVVCLALFFISVICAIIRK